MFDIEPPGAPPYPVFCGRGAPETLAALYKQGDWSRAVMIGDEVTDRLFGDGIEQALSGAGARPLRLRFSPGEAHKTRATKAALEDAMLAAEIDRRACVVAFGGGVVLDLAGFVAATFKRGIAHLCVATTLLAQVDAAAGGKTAVNTPLGKNLIGAFHHPRAVLLDTGALASLSEAELRSGLAELVKHAVLADAELFGELERWAAARAGLCPPDALIARAVEIKAAVVAEDDRDEGMRHVLNFGHTAAHAIEHASGHAVAHGLAVAAGMVIEADVAHAEGRFPSEDLERLVALLSQLGLPTSAALPFSEARPFLAQDKKTERGALRCAIPRAIGRLEPEPDGRWTRVVSLEALERAWSRRCSA